jgi:hypothetical protein
MSAPRRIQRKRTKGWRMPEGAVYVGRPTVFGNPYRVVLVKDCWTVLDDNDVDYLPWSNTQASARRRAVELFFDLEITMGLLGDRGGDPSILAGKDLACWCPLDQPCHADVLLKVANGVLP